MAATQFDSLTLRRGLEKLPQELYDMIYDLTFTAKPAVRQLGTIIPQLQEATPTPDVHPHWHLFRVDKQSQAKYAASYYGEGSTFVVYDCPTLATWLSELPENYRALVEDVRCIIRRGRWAGNRGDHSRRYTVDHPELKRTLEGSGLEPYLLAAGLRFGWENIVTSDLDGYVGSSVLHRTGS